MFMEENERMAELAVRQGFLEQRMKALRGRMEAGEAPEPLRGEFRKCFEESERIALRLAEYYQARERKLHRLEAKRRKVVKETAKENAGL
jgi:hypothetical protein